MRCLRRVVRCIVFFVFATFGVIHTSHAELSRIQGIASHYDSGVEQYQAALYVDSVVDRLSAEEAREAVTTMAFRIVRSRISPRTWIRDLSQRAAINNDIKLINQCSHALTELGALVAQPYRAGDIVEIQRDGEAVELVVNHVRLGRIEQKGFFELLLNAWIGSVPPSSEFKSALLRRPANAQEVIAYTHISELETRKARINEWLTSTADSAVLEVQVGDITRPEFEQTMVNTSNRPEKVNVDADVDGSLVLAPASVASLAEKKQKELAALEKQRREKDARAAELAKLEAQKQEKERLAKKLAEEKERLRQAGLVELAKYRQSLHRHPVSFIKYPTRSQARKEEGVVGVLITINRSGEVLHTSLERSSSYDRLDRAAINAVKKASPFPELPSGFKDDELEFVLPLAFRLQR